MPDALRSDHRDITAQLLDPESVEDSEAGDLNREQLVMDLVRHFVAEEQYLYPTVRDLLADGDRKAGEAFARDRECEQLLRRLEDPALDPDRLAELWPVLQQSFAHHTEEQEVLFAELAASCTDEQLNELGEQVRGVEQIAPTRPRRIAASSTGLNKVLSLIEGFVDRVRDEYTNRGVEPSPDSEENR